MEPRDGLLEVVPLDEPHGVERPAVGVGAQAVDRDDAGVLQPPGDLGLLQEAGPAVRVVGVSVADLLEGHLAVQLLVVGDVDGAQAAGSVQPQDAEPHAVGGGGAGRAGMEGRGVRVRTVVVPGNSGETGLQLGVGDPLQIVADRTQRAERGQALFGIAAMHLKVLAGQGLDQGVGLGVNGAALEQDPSQRPRLVGDPGGEGGQQRLAIDEVVLQSEEAEQQVVVRTGPGPGGPRRGRRAKNGLDHGNVLREPALIFLRRRPLAVLAAVGQLQCQQFAEQRRVTRLGYFTEVILDRRPAARLPGCLEAVAHRLHLSAQRGQAVPFLGRRRS